MAGPGDTFNLSDGEQLTVRTAAAQSGGELLEIDAEWSPKPRKPPGHYHPSQDEHFEVHEGELTAELGGKRRVLRAGDSLDVPRGTVHRIWNSGDGPARASWQVRPALRTEYFFQTVHELHAAGYVDQHGMLTPLAGGVLLRGFPDEFRLALPSLLQRPAAVVLGGIARLRGYPRAAAQ